MKTALIFALLATAAAQDRLTDILRKGVIATGSCWRRKGN